MKDEFISVVSHELRTPLTAIRGSLGLLRSGKLAARPERSQELVSLALDNCDRLMRLVNDILTLERLESGSVELVMESCRVSDLLQPALNSVQAIADQAGIHLKIRPVATQVRAAPDLIIQTLTNLLSNAIKFSPADSTVWLNAETFTQDSLQDSLDTSTTHVLFSVKDQGRGIPPDKLETIFDRFQQVDVSDSRQKGGTGLGLAICQSIVQKHGGQIWVESVPGQGSTFFFTLPTRDR
jgi:signal transduction histidine kinase